MTSYEGTHPAALVRVGDQQAQIDEQLAPTIQAIWECGFDTFTCCQDFSESKADWPQKLPHMREWVESKRGWMLIDLPADSGLAFLSAVANAGPRGRLRGRQRGDQPRHAAQDPDSPRPEEGSRADGFQPSGHLSSVLAKSSAHSLAKEQSWSTTCWYSCGSRTVFGVAAVHCCHSPPGARYGAARSVPRTASR